MNKNLQYTLSLKDLFTPKLKGAEAQTARLDNKMSKLGSQTGGLSRGFGSLGTAIAGAFSVSAIYNFGSAVVESYKNFEYFHASLKTMFHGNENAASALEDRLMTLAKTTPFQLTEVQNATKQLLAYGFKAGEVVDTMRTLGDVSAGVGAPLGDIAYLYGTLKTSGRVMQVDLRQFAGRGIPIYETLAKRLKVTTSEVNKLVHDGKIGFKEVEGAFHDMTKEGGQFFNLMNDQSKTLGGKISNLNDGWDQFKVNLGSTYSDNLKETFSFLAGALDQVNAHLANYNQLSKSLKSEGVGLSFWEKELRWVKMGEKIRVLKTQDALSQLREKEGMSDAEKINILNKTSKKLTVDFLTQKVLGKTDYDLQREYLQNIAQIKGELNFYKGEKDLKSTMSTSGNDDTKLNSSGLSSTSLGTGMDVTGNRPQNLYININKLVETLEVKSTTVKEAGTQIKETVSKVLLEAVNDVNNMNNGS